MWWSEGWQGEGGAVPTALLCLSSGSGTGHPNLHGSLSHEGETACDLQLTLAGSQVLPVACHQKPV